MPNVTPVNYTSPYENARHEILHALVAEDELEGRAKVLSVELFNGCNPGGTCTVEFTFKTLEQLPSEASWAERIRVLSCKSKLLYATYLAAGRIGSLQVLPVDMAEAVSATDYEEIAKLGLCTEDVIAIERELQQLRYSSEKLHALTCDLAQRGRYSESEWRQARDKYLPKTYE